MPRFSVRNGFVVPRTVIQTTTLDQETRIHIWNLVYVLKMRNYDYFAAVPLEDSFAMKIWVDWSKSLEDLQRLSGADFAALVKTHIVGGSLAETFDVLEACIEDVGKPMSDLLNSVFEKYLVGYRVVDGAIMPVTESSEVEAVEAAIEALGPYGDARKHLQNATSLLANRERPHYANVLKESISAVEAVARHLTGATTLGRALNQLEGRGIPAHRSLIEGWSRIYGYTNDEGGIRHGSINHGDVDEALATYFLVTCSSMVGYLIKKAGSEA